MKEQYLSLMAKALSAYSDRHIAEYFETVRTNGLTEHGFPRLTANLGILISYGFRTDLLPLFCEMMEFCCKSVPRVKAANDFSVRELLSCLAALENAQTVGHEMLDRWKGYLKTIVPQTCYSIYAKTPEDCVHNWACFTLVSEYLRQTMGLCDSADFVELQLSTQLRLFDENGMYRDPNQPMVYDLVPRGLFSLLLFFGYRGPCFSRIDALLKRAGLHTLEMQSVTGEIPYGGRSNQFLFNEPLFAILFEYEAARYAGEGDFPLARRFKGAAQRALSALSHWLGETPIRHVKNRFPEESRYGCERYAYFDKYMITTASFLYAAFLLCDDTIVPEAEPEIRPAVFRTSADFHKVFLRSAVYALELDLCADPHYDASGLGRVQREGAPSALCLSHPCTDTPKYTVDREDPIPLSICPGLRKGNGWCFATGPAAEYTVTRLTRGDRAVCAAFSCRFDGGETAFSCTADDGGVGLEIRGAGAVACLLPAFSFDGESETQTTAGKSTLSVAYRGWICRYTTDGVLSDTGRTACNRNGHYRAFFAAGEKCLRVRIVIEKQS